MRLSHKASSAPLCLGKAFHACIGEWYKRRRCDMAPLAARHLLSLKDIARESMMYFDEEEYEKLQSGIQTFVGMLTGYAAVNASDRTSWQILDIEKPFIVNMGDFDFAGKVDLVARTEDGQVFVAEHKTARRIDVSYIDRLPIDTQVRGYLFGAKEGLGHPIDYILYDVIRKSNLRRKSNESAVDFDARVEDDYFRRPDFNFYREPLHFPQAAIASFEHDLRLAHSEYLAIVRSSEWKDPSFLSGLRMIDSSLQILPPTDPSAWMTNDGECYAYFRNCEYLPLCVHGVDRGSLASFAPHEALNMELESDE